MSSVLLRLRLSPPPKLFLLLRGGLAPLKGGPGVMTGPHQIADAK